jgi:shikimate dehydrogenase
MNVKTLRPVAFIGPDAPDLVRRLYSLTPRFLPLEVPPGSHLSASLEGLPPLGFLGAILSGPAQHEALGLVTRRAHSAERDGAVDAVAVHGSGTFGTHTLEDALAAALDASGFRAVGGRAIILGSGPAAFAATQVARLGLTSVVVAAPDRPAAERVARALPAGVEAHALSLDEDRFLDQLQRADLIVHCGTDARVDPRRLEPFHTLVEAAGETNLSIALERAGGQVVPYSTVSSYTLAAQLEFVTGLKFDPRELVPVEGA